MKPLAFVLLGLVGSLILANLPAPSYADPNLDTLLRIATQARDNINIQLSQLPSVPDEINQLYKQGTGETDALAQSVSQGDQASAKNHFLSAMRIFKSVNDKIPSLTPATTSGSSQIDTSQLKDDINRKQNLGDRLKTIATNNNVEINFTKFDVLMQDARQNLDAGNADQVKKDLGNVNQFLLDAHHVLANAAIKKTSDRAKNFTVKEIQKLSQEPNSVQNVTRSSKPLGTPPSEIINATQTVNVNDMIVKLRQLVLDGKIDEALKLIKTIQALQSQEIRPQVSPTETPNVAQPAVVNNVNATHITNPVNNSTTTNQVTQPPTIQPPTETPNVAQQAVVNNVNATHITNPVNNSTTTPNHVNNSTTTQNHVTQPPTPLNQTNSKPIPKQVNPPQSDTGNSVNATQKTDAANNNQHNNDNGKASHGKKNNNDSNNDGKNIRTHNSND